MYFVTKFYIFQGAFILKKSYVLRQTGRRGRRPLRILYCYSVFLKMQAFLRVFVRRRPLRIIYCYAVFYASILKVYSDFKPLRYLRKFINSNNIKGCKRFACNPLGFASKSEAVIIHVLLPKALPYLNNKTFLFQKFASMILLKYRILILLTILLCHV